jgi:hypothetical protein
MNDEVTQLRAAVSALARGANQPADLGIVDKTEEVRVSGG